MVKNKESIINKIDFLCCLGSRKKEDKEESIGASVEEIETTDTKLTSSEDNQLQSEEVENDGTKTLSVEIVNKLKSSIPSTCYNRSSGEHQYTKEQELLIDTLITDTDLKERFKKYGLCSKCEQPNSGELKHVGYWCHNCETNKQWIDNFIQKHKNHLEWIPYGQFSDIKYLAEGGFGKVYKAKWRKDKSGNDKIVALKFLNNSQNKMADFLEEIGNHKLFDDSEASDYVVSCYGISQDPITNNYTMVMRYIEEGNLRQYLGERQLSFINKLNHLKNIAAGLNFVHKKGFVHRDFHSGNILNSFVADYCTNCHVTDLGLCRPVDEIDKRKIYGVLPYIAPEVLLGKEYTQDSDVYSFGIVAYELLSNAYPYPNLENLYPNLKGRNNKELEQAFIFDVCDKLRPEIDKLKIPVLLKDLINKCWDIECDNRPKIGEIYKTLQDWCREIRDKKDTEFYQQYSKIEINYNTFSQNTPYQIHPTAMLVSRPINKMKVSEEQAHSDNKYLFINASMEGKSNQKNIQEQSSTQAQTEQPPK